MGLDLYLSNYYKPLSDVYFDLLFPRVKESNLNIQRRINLPFEDYQIYLL